VRAVAGALAHDGGERPPRRSGGIGQAYKGWVN
jgi:hypothetical protein